MIIVRAPVRISFVGGGTDLPDFYTRTPGRVISTAINKYSYVVVNAQPLSQKVAARYRMAEQVDHPRELKNDRIREALLHFGITKSVDIATFSDVPVNTGLGSSSSFSVALMKALLLSRGKTASKGEIAELASHLEINLVGDPIGKQDQYAAAFGGMNIFQFNADHSVEATPVFLDYTTQAALESHLQVFYTGIERLASSVLTEQRANIDKKFATLKKMADSVPEFRDRLLAQDFPGLGRMLHETWLMKKSLATNVSMPVIDRIYDAGIKAGAWGGKILGAGGGGCVMFLTPVDKKATVSTAVASIAKQNNLADFREIPVRLVHAGAEVLMNNEPEGSTNLA